MNDQKRAAKLTFQRNLKAALLKTIASKKNEMQKRTNPVKKKVCQIQLRAMKMKVAELEKAVRD